MINLNYKNEIIFFVLLVLTIPIVSRAQENKVQVVVNEPAKNTEYMNQTIDPVLDEAPQIGDSDVKLFVDKIEVVGQLEKPQALFILPGSTPDIDDIQIDHSFFNEIFRPVEKRGRILTQNNKEIVKDRKDYIPW